MRVNGEWLICQDGTIRPTLTGLERIPGGDVIEVPFLLDAGADRTVLSVLGRDVTNNFSVIYDYPNRAVALLARPHYYEIKKAS